MPQVFQVVQCYNCHVYQVDIVKKVPKWNCKICNAKQSVIKVYSRGTGKDCRLHVQELNEKRITMDNNICELVTSSHVLENENQEYELPVDNRQNSKWVQFMENNETIEEETTCESFIETRMALYADNAVSSVTSDNQIACESHLETTKQYGSATTEHNTPGLYLENQIPRQEINVDNTNNSKWSKFMEKCETSDSKEQIAYESLLETGFPKQNFCVGSKENDNDQVDDFTSDWDTKKLADPDENVDRIENVECIKSHHLSEKNACVQKKEDDYDLKDVNVTDNELLMGRAQCHLRRVKSKIVEIDKKDSKRKKFSDSKNIFDWDSQHNIESLLDI